MASPSLRSSRRSEGHTPRSSTRNHVATHPKIDSPHTTQQLSNIGRKKRPRESTDSEEQNDRRKKPKIAVDIVSSTKPVPKTRSFVINKSNANSDVAHQRSTAAGLKTAKTTQTGPQPPPQKTTIHQEKVGKGIRHELDKLHDRLAPSQDELKDEKRKLRSQEGTRFKSELSAYFPEYDEVIGNDPKEDHILNIGTPIIVVDSARASLKSQPSPSRKANEYEYNLKQFLDYLFSDLYKAQRVDFSFLNSHYDNEADLLSAAYFAFIHRKPERQEKAIRNTDKGRAQHEKDQVIRLLEGLQGHDWLKLMGVSGITDSKKKDYEPARAYFIQGCEAILEKFRIWREEEKRRKVARDMAVAQSEAEVEAEEDEEAEQDEEMEDEGNVSDGDPPDYSDVDASAARQLHDEAIARSAPLQASRIANRRVKVELIPDASNQIERDFTSFFSKPHLRNQALGNIRRSGRSVAAWGHPVPDLPSVDFDLPEEFRDEETLKAHARQKRRDRRYSKD